MKQKVLRVPFDKYNYTIEKLENKPQCDYGIVNKFQIAPTKSNYLDYVLNIENNCEANECGRCRKLTDEEKEKYYPIFIKMIKCINMNDVRLIEFISCNYTEAPDYYI